jgi:hypothetical protein
LQQARAFDLRLLDDSTAVALMQSGPDMVVRSLALGSGRAAELARQPQTRAPRLALDAAHRRFCAIDFGARATSRVCGTLGQASLARTSWNLPRSGFAPAVPADSDMLLVMSFARPSAPAVGGPFRKLLLRRSAPRAGMDLTWLTPDGHATPIARSTLRMRCSVDAARSTRYLCSASERERAVLWELDAASHTRRPLATTAASAGSKP